MLEFTEVFTRSPLGDGGRRLSLKSYYMFGKIFFTVRCNSMWAMVSEEKIEIKFLISFLLIPVLSG